MEKIQCIPNFSSADKKLIEELVINIGNYAKVINYSSDVDHNRSVITFVGSPSDIFNAIDKCAFIVKNKIDISKHKGVHPRVGAIDVIPCVPLFDTPMEIAIDLAHKIGDMFFSKYSIPVFFYEEAAKKEENRFLEKCRSCNYESLDLGNVPNLTLGASVVGARCPLIAYNVNLNTNNLCIAKLIAKEIRRMRRSGDIKMYGVKAIGLELKKQNIIQVSTNITRPHITGVFSIFEYIKNRAMDFGVEVVESELIGAIPSDVASDIIKDSLKFRDFDNSRIIFNS